MIGFILGRLLLAADVLWHGPTDPEPHRPEPKESPWAHLPHDEARKDAALALLDEEVVGFFQLRFLTGDYGLETDSAFVIEAELWPVVVDMVMRDIMGKRS